MGSPTATNAAGGVVSGGVFKIPSDAVDGSTYFLAAAATSASEDYFFKYYAFIIGAEATSCNAELQLCPVEESEGGGGGAVVIIIVVLLIGAGAAAYFLLL